MNRHLRTVIVAPLTSQGRLYPTRVPCTFDGRDGLVVLDQIRTVDTLRLVKRLGQMDPLTMTAVLSYLERMFAP
jgi:mRNA interferase MazF